MIVGFVGAGNIASSIARGWSSAGDGPEQMLFTDSGSGRAASLASEVGGEAVDSNAELARRSDVLLLAMKPRFLDEVAPEAQGAEIVVSLLGATPLDQIAEAFPDSTAFRLLPNPGVEVRRGVMCLVTGDAPAEKAEVVRSLFEPLGRIEELDDSVMDQATSVMGCAMAYFAVAVEAVADAGAVDGFDRDLSLSLAADTAAGTAEMLRHHSPQELRSLVASPGGDTEKGLEELERRRGREAFEAALRASLQSSRSRH
jgi:pyrroline-5-carboxylate reductase